MVYRRRVLFSHIQKSILGILLCYSKSRLILCATGGFKFYDRTEIKVVLDYLRVISKPESNDALARIINVPSRRIGEATIKSLLEEADQGSKTLWTVILDAARGNRAPKTKLGEQASKGISALVNIVLSGRKKLLECQPTISDLIDHILKKTSFEDHLTRTYPEDHEQRWANIIELINQANDFFAIISTGYEDETLPEIEGLHQAENPDTLSKFLANVALASDIKDESDEAPIPQITISTIHAAKGLEWPVVFIPAVYDGHIPHSRAEDTDEERRLLYVAMTRAKALLYMSYPLKNTHHDDATLCQFLTSKSFKHHIEDQGPSLTASVTQCIAQVLRRALPSETVISQACQSLKSTEDDIWPVDGVETSKSKDGEWNGRHNYTEGQQPIKRRRVDSDFLGGRHQIENEPVFLGHKTTMNQVSGFSVASTTLGSGFTSAGLHMKTLVEQSASNFEKRTEREDSNETSKVHAVSKSSRQSSSKERKRPANQGNISSFFTKQSTTSKPTDKMLPQQNVNTQKPPNIRNDSKIVSRTNGNQAPIYASTLSSTVIQKELSGIQPSLANHRINIAPLPRPISQPDQNPPTKPPRSYKFLSSSPPPPEIEISQEQENNFFKEQPHQTPEDVIEVAVTRPVATMHMTTTMTLKNANMPKRTLGVRRSMNGWSSRQGQGQGFVPPTILRKPNT